MTVPETVPQPAPSDDPATAPGGGTVRVVTVAYNPGEELDRFLTSLRTATRREVRTVIADNGEDHDVVEAAARAHGARVVGDGTNRGYGGGANLAAADLTEDWIVVANPDLVWQPGSLDALVDVSLASPRAGCLGPRILNPDGTVYPSGRALPSLVGGAGHALLSRLWPSNPFSAAYHSQPHSQPHSQAEPRTGVSGWSEGTEADKSAAPGGRSALMVREVGWLSGACLLLPAAAWQRLGGFDESYFMFFEDVDLGRRVSAAGWVNLQVLDCEVVHEQGASWRSRPERMIRAHHASARRYMAGQYTAPWQAPVRWAVTGGLRLREEIVARQGRRRR
ncbi:glycosyltransferase family 2 protein [Actinomyces sp. 2119]|uniref:glycosyltransferase n=1 Tax=Actinomyces sp. 2119 TaxID=2321393 RepID=UPI000E6B9519|nr:glycosyltransferase family 2 protein [Actinomyces sp. 2119]RJF41538.1 glycosyltransferase family 2 protein [Actinomyces sp. 2119]